VVLARAAALAHGRIHRTDRLDALVARVAELGSREPLDDLGPELDGGEVMRLLGLPPGRQVGEALAHLQRLRLDEGVLGRDEVSERIRRWWSART
jgi:poly(A) polymerase